MTDPTTLPPCVGCGHCCTVEVCGLGLEIVPAAHPPCPLLIVRAGRSRCSAIEAAEQVNIAFGAHMAWRLGIGVGCSAKA